MSITLGWVARHLKALGLNVNVLLAGACLARCVISLPSTAAPGSSPVEHRTYLWMKKMLYLPKKLIEDRRRKLGVTVYQLTTEDRKLTTLKMKSLLFIILPTSTRQLFETAQTTCQALAEKPRINR